VAETRNPVKEIAMVVTDIVVNGIREAIRNAAGIYRPGLVRAGGKLDYDASEDYINICEIAESIASHAPYEAMYPGCDGNRSGRLKAALAEGYLFEATVWDSEFGIVVNANGGWKLLSPPPDRNTRDWCREAAMHRAKRGLK
jgi:hypothetical protein